MRQCTVEGCNAKHVAKGLCKFHYHRSTMGRDLTAPIRKFSYTSPDGMRICLSCGVSKPLTEFVKSGAGYHRARCQPCWAGQRRRERTSCPENIAHSRQYANEWNDRNREHVKEKRRANWKLLRLRILKIYGESCACCGESIPEFLAVDHVNGNGTKEVLQQFKNRISWYWWIAEEKRPGLRTLCHNCNLGRSFSKSKECPHEKYKRLRA